MVGRRSLRGVQPLSHEPVPLGNCPLCGRPMVVGKSIDEHHLLPKSQGGREKFAIHRICHRKIHATISEKELARNFTTWSLLHAHEEMATFIVWVKNKPPEFYDNSRKSANRR